MRTATRMQPWILLFGLCAGWPAMAQQCHAIHGTLSEDRVVTGCDPGEAFCFLGTFQGNQSLQGTTHFKADSAAAGPATGSPGFISYSGPFEYRFPDGVLRVRETGLANPRKDTDGSGTTLAYHQVIGGTGAFAQATGHLVVSGVNLDGHVETLVDGTLCAFR